MNMADTADIEIAREALSKTRVYLDIKYWILLRDAARGAPQSRESVELLDTLRAAVAAGTHVCPIELIGFSELLKQESRDREIEAARLMDELSRKVVLKPFNARVQAEILHFLYSRLRPSASLHTVEELVWTNPMYMVGKMVPKLRNASAEDNQRARTELDRIFRSYGIEQILAEGDGTVTWPQRQGDSLAAYINAQNAAHVDDVKSGVQTYHVELRGAFLAFESILSDAVTYFATQQPDPVAAVREVMEMTGGASLSSCFAEIALKEGAARLFPTFHVLATVYARVRWDRARQYRPNDFEDFLHAAAALPYCDIFLTERSLASLLEQGTEPLTEILNTRVAFSAAEAIALVNS